VLRVVGTSVGRGARSASKAPGSIPARPQPGGAGRGVTPMTTTTTTTHPPGFHVADGLFFRPILLDPDDRYPTYTHAVEVSRWENHEGTWVQVWSQTIDEGSWCSVVSSMSVQGETTLTFGLARTLHIGGAHR